MQPNTKMSSGQATFDLKAAREIALDPNFYGNAPYLAANLNDALDEIERLHGRIEYQADAIGGLANRIAELENSLGISAIETRDFQIVARKQRAALKKLGQAKRERGKSLVEERISGEFSDWIENQCPHWDIDEEPFCVELDGPCEYMEGKCPISMELHRIAREQLRREGKL